jgi:AcrR family transcriptional regulator
MARPKQDPSAVPTRERLLAAGAEEFADEGFSRATLAAIARRAGISRPSLLHHFPSKDALYTEVVTATFADLAQRLLVPLPVAGPARVVAMALAFESYLAAHPAQARIIVREILENGPGQPILTERVAPLLDQVTLLVASSGPLRAGLPVRAAVLQVASSVLVQAATPVRDVLWGGPPATEALIRHLFLEA